MIHFNLKINVSSLRVIINDKHSFSPFNNNFKSILFWGGGGSFIPKALKLKENGAHVEVVCPLFSSTLLESKSRVCSREQGRN